MIFLCVQQKKETHTGLQQLVNDDRIFIFGWSIPLMKLWFFFTETLWGKGKGTQTSGTFGAIRSKEAVPPNNGEVISTLSVYLPALRFSFFSFCRHAYFTHPECVLGVFNIQGSVIEMAC